MSTKKSTSHSSNKSGKRLHVYILYMYMVIHVHSTLAKEYNGRKVIPTQTNKATHIKAHIYVHHTQEIENCIEK